MIRMLIRVAVLLGSSALGLIIARLVVSGFDISASGFITAVIVFTAAQAILAPFIFSVARKHASALLGGIGLVSTFVALLIASLFPNGLRLSGVSTWIAGTVIVWLVTALGTWLIPIFIAKRRVAARADAPSA